MKTRFLAVLVALAVPLAALAQPAPSDGEVTKVDRPAARLTIKHRGVKNLDMPPMAMSFHVADGKLLEGIAAGDKVRFTADKLGGSYTVTTLQKSN